MPEQVELPAQTQAEWLREFAERYNASTLKVVTEDINALRFIAARLEQLEAILASQASKPADRS